jgi:hypothetical protein
VLPGAQHAATCALWQAQGEKWPPAEDCARLRVALDVVHL